MARTLILLNGLSERLVPGRRLVQASLIQEGTAVLLKPPTGRGWRFLSVGGTLGLEESTYLGVADVPRRCEQIVITGPLKGEGARVKWAFRREGDAA